MRRTALLAGCMALGICLLWSCGNDEELADAYSRGYRKGAEAAVQAMREKGEHLRGEALARSFPRMVLGAFLAVMATWFGPDLAESARKRLSALFRITPEAQAKIAAWAYGLAMLCAGVWSLAENGMAMSAPLFILLAGTLRPFMCGYLPAVRNGDAAGAKAGLAKIKTLLFLCVALALALRLLAGGGIGNIKLGL